MEIFHQNVETYSRCCPSIFAVGLPGFQNFAHKFSLTRFFPKKAYTLTSSGKTNTIKFVQSSVTKDIILLIHIKKLRRLCHKAPKKHHTLHADVLPNASEALFLGIFMIVKDPRSYILLHTKTLRYLRCRKFIYPVIS